MSFEPIDISQLGHDPETGVLRMDSRIPAFTAARELRESSDELVALLAKVATASATTIAATIFNAWNTHKSALGDDGRLTPEGRLDEVNRRVAAKRKQLLQEIAQYRAGVIGKARREVDRINASLDKLLAPPTEPGLVARAAEIRTWFSRQSADDRLRVLASLSTKGDLETAHALVNAPKAMGLVSDFEHERLRNVIARSTGAQGFDRLVQLEQAITSCEDALARAEEYLTEGVAKVEVS